MQTNQDLLWLTSAAAEEILLHVAEQWQRGVPILTMAKQLRRTLTPVRSALVMELVQLRRRAQEKFPAADQMFFTRRSLEQSTDFAISQYKAQRFKTYSAIADICCGIGGDLIGLANLKQPDVLGLDCNSVLCEFARQNCRVCGGDAQVECQAFEHLDLNAFTAIHIDPDRRDSKRRTNAERFQPPLSEIRHRVGSETGLSVKLAPATRLDDDQWNQAEREWIGRGRECKQQILWTGPLRRNPGCRTATVIQGQRIAHFAVPNEDRIRVEQHAEQLGRWTYEPHAAVLAAELTDTLADRFGLKRLAPGIGYLTGDLDQSSLLWARFETLSVARIELREVKRELERLNVGPIEIKNRGIGEETLKPFRRLKSSGTIPATLLFTPTRSGGRVLITRRC